MPLAMQLSAQLSSGIAGVLLVIPMFLLGKHLFDRRVGFGGALLFQCLPSGGRVLGDGLSEALFLLLAACALYSAARAFSDRSTLWFGLAGAASGLAYLTRPEGLILAAATGVVLVAAQAVARWRRPWRDLLTCGATLTLATLVVAGPYMALIRGVTVKQAANRVGERLRELARTPDSRSLDRRIATLGMGMPLFADWSDPNPDLHSFSERRVWALLVVPNMLIRGFFWSSWLPVLIGLWARRDLFRDSPFPWVILLACALIALSLFAVAAVVGYASDRHLLLLIMLGCYWAAAGIPILGRGIASVVLRLLPFVRGTRLGESWIYVAGLWILMCVGPLFRTLEPLHADRAGFRQAGYWLAQHAWTGDEIDDAYAWANYYAGHVFTEVDPADGLRGMPGPAHEPRIRYVVMEVSDNEHAKLQRWQKEKPEELLAAGGREEQAWRLSSRKDNAAVKVFSVPVTEDRRN
jgi:4-amino-4-deoxy-L-arabinose transferase-like glycosyltransferase